MKKGLLCILFLISAYTGKAQTAVIDSLLRLIAKHPRDTNEIRTLGYLATEFMRKDIGKAKYYSYQQIALAESLNTGIGLMAAYAGLVSMHQDTGNPDSAQYYLEREKAYMKKYSPTAKEATNYNTSTGLFYKNQGKYKEALPYLKEALRLISTTDDKTSRAGLTLNLGNVYFELGDLKNAADYHLKALKLFEEIKNKRGQSFCLQSLGNDFLALRQYPAAESYFLNASQMKDELNDKRGAMTSWMTLGELYQQTNKLTLSMQYANKALVRARELKMTIQESRILFNIALLLKRTKQTDAARQTFDEALILTRNGGDSLLVSKIKMELISMQNDLQKDSTEELILSQNIEVSLEKGARSSAAEGYQRLADWYAKRKQFEKGFNFLLRAQQLNDTIRGNEVVMQLKRLEEEYKNEKKEKEIALLKKDQELHTLALSRQRVIITSIAIALISVILVGFLLVNRYRVMNRSKRLIEIERMRNTIARDLHDDIGSTLSGINILSQVALVEKNGNTHGYLRRIGDQSARMMEDMSDMVWSISPHNDSMQQLTIRMREFATEILELKKTEFRFVENVKEGTILTAEQRKNFFLIFKESINNAAKYSDAKLIEINVQHDGQTLVLHVKDDGRGFDKGTIKEGNGLRNLRERALDINGTLTLKSEPGEGTEVNLVLPLT